MPARMLYNKYYFIFSLDFCFFSCYNIYEKRKGAKKYGKSSGVAV